MRPDTVRRMVLLLSIYYSTSSKSIILEGTGLFLHWFSCTATVYNRGKCKIVNHLQEGPGSALIQGRPIEGHFAEGEKSNDGSHFPFLLHLPIHCLLLPALLLSLKCRTQVQGEKKKKKRSIRCRRRDTGKWKHPLYSQHGSPDRLWSDKVWLRTSVLLFRVTVQQSKNGEE